MAAPVIIGGTAPAAGLSSTSHANTLIGDMVIVVTWERAGAGAPTHTLQSGFVQIISHLHDDGSTDGRLSVAYKIATQNGAQSYQAYTTSGSGTVRTASLVLDEGTFSTSGLKTNSATQTNNAVPDPPSITAMTGDWLILAIAGWHLGSAATVAVTPPTNYTEQWEAAGSQDVEISLATRARTGLANATEDPGTFGDDVAPNGTAIITIGIPELLVISPTAIASSEAHGSTNLDKYVAPSAIASVEAHGTSHLAFTLIMTGISSAETHGTAEVLASSPQEITSAGAIASEQAFGTALIVSYVDATGIASAEAFGTAVMTSTVSPAAIASSEAHGTAVIVETISPSSVASAEAFGTAQLNQTIAPTGVASAQAFGTASFEIGAQYVDATGVASSEAHGTAKLELVVAPAGVVSAEAHGSTRLELTVAPSGVVSSEAHGTTSLAAAIAPGGVVSAEAFGETALGLIIMPAGVISAEAFGSAFVGPPSTSAEGASSSIVGAQVFGVFAGESDPFAAITSSPIASATIEGD